MSNNLLIALIGALGVGLAVSGLLYPVRRKLAQGKSTAGLDGVSRLSGADDDLTLLDPVHVDEVHALSFRSSQVLK